MQKDILFIDAACKSREKFLLGADKYARLIDADGYSSGIKLLREYNFGKSAKEDADLSDILYAEEEDLIAFIKEYAPKSGVHNYFLLPYDFINAEALFKCSKLGLDEEKYLTHEGVLKIDDIKKALDGKSSGIGEIDKAIRQAEDLFGDGKEPSGSLVDTVFARNMYTAMRRLVKDGRTLKFIEREIDLKNISVLLRSETFEEYLTMKLPYGTLTLAQEKVLNEKNGEKILAVFKRTVFFEFLQKAFAPKDNPLTEYEKAVDGYNLKKLKETRFFNQGTEPYLLYVGYRKADIKNVRLILSGLRSGLSREVIKEKLRESY